MSLLNFPDLYSLSTSPPSKGLESMDLSELSVAELNQLLSDIPKEVSRREKGE